MNIQSELASVVSAGMNIQSELASFMSMPGSERRPA
jgi:hypothetical protein